MINPNVVKAVQELLAERGIEQRENETLQDYMARGLRISDSEAGEFLELVHDGCSLEEAQAKTGISLDAAGRGLLADIARVIGSAIGRVSR